MNFPTKAGFSYTYKAANPNSKIYGIITAQTVAYN